MEKRGYVERKVKNKESWVNRWLELRKGVLYSYHTDPTLDANARMINMLDIRKVCVRVCDSPHSDVARKFGSLIRLAPLSSSPRPEATKGTS